MKYQPAEEKIDSQAVDPSEIAASLRSLWHSIIRGTARQAEAHGLQRQQFWVLGALMAGPRRMSDLAECAQTSQASLTGIVDRLEEQGLVQRTRSGDDRRVVQVEATGEGRRVLAETHELFVRRLEAIIEPLTEDERAQLLRLLQKVSEDQGDKAGACS